MFEVHLHAAQKECLESVNECIGLNNRDNTDRKCLRFDLNESPSPGVLASLASASLRKEATVYLGFLKSGSE